VESKYIYGIIEASEGKLSNSGGIAAHEQLYTVPYQDISAVVSDSQFVDYTTLPKDQVARYLLAHQQVIEKIMDSYTIIPMRLGTYAFNIGEVKEILSKGYAMFKDIFKKINNKIEIDVVATWSDLNSVIKEIGESEEIKEHKEKLMSKSGGVSVKDQMMIGSRIKHILDKKKERCSFEIEAALKECSLDFRKHDLMDDRMIINTAFLISKDNHRDFDEKVEELNRRYLEKVNFRCVGPLPTYSFYTAEIKKIRFDEIDWARKRLCLNDVVTKDEIQKAYRNLALAYHPDRNPGTLDSDKEFNEVNKAYRLLLEYCLSAEQGGKREPYSLREEEFAKNAIIVKVRD
jgi:hypothetical protein